MSAPSSTSSLLRFLSPGRVTLLILLALMGGCYRYTFTDWATIRYRMTVTVDTPEGVRTGSAVHEFSRYETADWLLPLNHYNATTHFRGEAVVLDLGERGVLFVTTIEARRGTGNHVFAQYARNIVGLGNYGERFEERRLLMSAAKADLPPVQVAPSDFPLMVRFRNLTDPLSVEAVTSAEIAATFGAGVSLRGITIQVTRDEPQSVILRWLPWLPDYRGKLFDGRKVHTIEAENKLANSLGSGAFSNILPR